MNILITGISSGIGRATAIHFIQKGHCVWGLARRQHLLKKLHDELNSKDFFYSMCDLQNQEEILNTLGGIKQKKFFPDVVILNAGILIDELPHTYNNEIYEKTFAVNLHAPMMVVHFFLTDFLARGAGQFIAINSTSAFRPNRRSQSYSSSKAALSMMFKGLSESFRDKNISFSTIYLGPVSTSMWEGKRSFLIAREEKVASFIETLTKSKKEVSYFPPLSTFLFRLGTFFPNSFYHTLSDRLLK